MASRFKLSNMELASLSVLTIVIVIIIAVLFAGRCSTPIQSVNDTACDSISTMIHSRLTSGSDTVKIIGKAKKKRTNSADKSPYKIKRVSKQRNHLDEPAND